MGSSPVRVVQLSDPHFSTAPGGYGLRDTAETFAAVVADVLRDPPDMVVVSGDIANDGTAAEYELAGEALETFGLPVYCLPGNHDRVDALHAYLPRPGIVVQRSMRVGQWLFLFGDSNDGGVVFDDDLGWIDRPERMEMARGAIHRHELAWLRRQLDEGGASHAMLWLHHPPGALGLFARPELDAQVASLAGAATPIRAVAAGHVHTGVQQEVAAIPVHVCPSTGVCVDFDASTLMPPGYRRFEFHANGTLSSDVVWLDDERWNNRPALPEGTVAYFSGEMSGEEMAQYRRAMRAVRA